MFWRETTRPVKLDPRDVPAGLGLGYAPRQLQRDAHGFVITREKVGYCGAAPFKRSNAIES